MKGGIILAFYSIPYSGPSITGPPNWSPILFVLMDFIEAPD